MPNGTNDTILFTIKHGAGRQRQHRYTSHTSSRPPLFLATNNDDIDALCVLFFR